MRDVGSNLSLIVNVLFSLIEKAVQCFCKFSFFIRTVNFKSPVLFSSRVFFKSFCNRVKRAYLPPYNDKPNQSGYEKSYYSGENYSSLKQAEDRFGIFLRPCGDDQPEVGRIVF